MSQIRIDYAFGLELAEDQQRAIDQPWRLRINTPFRYRRPGAPEVVIDPEDDPTALAPALSVRHQTVAHGRVHADGRLSLSFTDGAAIEERPSGGWQERALRAGELCWAPAGRGRRRHADRKVDGGFHFLTGPARLGAGP